jgi:hypothetical protein
MLTLLRHRSIIPRRCSRKNTKRRPWTPRLAALERQGGAGYDAAVRVRQPPNPAREVASHFRGLRLTRLPRTFDWQSASDWQCWWDDHADELTPEQRRGIWEALDRLHFYEVVPVELEG